MLTLPEKVIFAAVLLGAAGYFAWRAVTLVRMLRAGKPDSENRFARLPDRIVNAFLDVFLQRKVLRKPVVGFLHLFIVWGFFVFAGNTINHFTGAFLEGFHLFGTTRLALYYSVLADLFALLIILGVLGLAFRRYVLRPESLTRPSAESVIVFTFIGGAMAAFLVDTGVEITMGRIPHPGYHFGAAAIAAGLARLHPAPVRVAAHLAWWSDGLMHLGLIWLLVVPTKHLHLVAGPFNLLFQRSRPRGQMTTMDLENEDAESFGVSRITDFSWKHLLDLYACIECGRCQDFCPTYLSGKPLKPKHLIVDLKHHLLDQGPALLKRRAGNTPNGGSGKENGTIPNLIGEIVDVDSIWACTTCAACIEHCPMAIEHVDKIADLRRHLVLMEADFPETAATTFRNMETAGNPWGLARAERAAWAAGLDVPLMAEKGEADVLYWVGCSGAYDDRSKKISLALVKILKAAHVNFAILGEEERCTCESARRLGNEYLYQTATQEILETLKQYRFNKILVTCPHCFNTFANEYPAFGASYPVVHHAQFIQGLLESGKLKRVNRTDGDGLVVFHDSCYLGRYNGIFDAPRRVLEAAGRILVPVPRERARGLCCGAGGGRMWLEETLGKPINLLRLDELLTTKARQVAAACPFCITMLTDAAKKLPNAEIEIKDLAEIVAESFGG
jgi:Fe-S oxidoreductase